MRSVVAAVVVVRVAALAVSEHDSGHE